MESPPAVAPPPAGVNIIIYSAAQGVSALGSWMQRAGMGWMAWELTHSPAWVGALALTEAISALCVSPLAGVVADRTSAFRVLMVTQSLMMAQAFGLFLYVWSGHAVIWGLLAFALADSIFSSLNAPVRLTVVNQIAPRDRLSQAIASNSMFFNLARITGPATAGAIMATGHVAPVFAINTTSYVVFIGALLYLRPWIDRPSHDGAKGGLGGEITAGFRYIAGTPHIATLFMLAAAFSLLARPFGEILPAINGAVFHGGPAGLSAMMSAQGVGAFIGAALMLRRRGTRRILMIAFVCGIALPATIVAMVCMPSLAWAVPVLAVSGLVHVCCNISMQSLAQTFAEERFRGRVMSLYGLLFRSAPSLGGFLIALAAEQWGLRALLGGAAALGVLVTVAISVRAWRVYGASIEPA